jgi:hypothetical protein
MHDFHVMTDGESAGQCDCCGNATRTVWGYVDEGDRTVAAYFVSWTRNKPDHYPSIDFLVGPWGSEFVRNKQLIAWLYNPMMAGGSFMVVDSAARPAARSDLCAAALTRQDVLADAALFQSCKQLLDAIWMQDERLDELKEYTRAEM